MLLLQFTELCDKFQVNAQEALEEIRLVRLVKRMYYRKPVIDRSSQLSFVFRTRMDSHYGW